MARNEYKLLRGGIALGVIEHRGDDQPYHIGQFTPWPAFADIRSLFEQEIRLLESVGSSVEWQSVRQEIDGPGLALEPHEWVGNQIVKPLLHIKGTEVWWR